MKWNKNILTHLLLIVLVLLSLLLTYFIITSPVQLLNWLDTFGEGDRQSVLDARQLSAGDTSDDQQVLDRVLQPEMLIFHDGNDNYLATIQTNRLKEAKEAIESFSFNGDPNIEEISAQTFRENIKEKEYVEIHYSDIVTSAFFKNMQDTLGWGEKEISFDALILLPEEREVYVILEKEGQVYGMTLKETIEENLSYQKLKVAEGMIDVTPVVFKYGRNYVTKEKQTFFKRTYMLERQPNTLFLGALFSSPDEIHDYSDEQYARYYANGHQLAINNETYEVGFTQDNEGSSQLSAYKKLIETYKTLTSFVPNNDVWMLVDYQANDNLFTYRKMIDHLPVFGSDHVSKMDFRMTGNQLTYLRMSALTIQTELTDLEEEYEIMSGTDALEILRNSNVDSSEIEDMQIGYRWVKSPDSQRLIELIPAWHIKQDGIWYMLEDIVDMSNYKDLQLRHVETNTYLDWDTYIQDSENRPAELEADPVDIFQSSGQTMNDADSSSDSGSEEE